MLPHEVAAANGFEPLNESPSEKEGKFRVPPGARTRNGSLNESPSEKEGKLVVDDRRYDLPETLNESPSEKEGKYWALCVEHQDAADAPQ